MLLFPVTKNAGVGLVLVNAPDALNVKDLIGQLRVQMGEDAFFTAAGRVAGEPPEPAYGQDQAARTTAIRSLAAQALPHTVQEPSLSLNRAHH